MQIILNGEAREVTEGQTVMDLLRALAIDPERVAVEMNRSIIRQTDWTVIAVPPGARIEIVQFVGGG
ncbi:MAG: sulfur carrier protein ThiS [Bryobacteraceae bacterium]